MDLVGLLFLQEKWPISIGAAGADRNRPNKTTTSPRFEHEGFLKPSREQSFIFKTDFQKHNN
jgi:hypothetical protein